MYCCVKICGVGELVHMSVCLLAWHMGGALLEEESRGGYMHCVGFGVSSLGFNLLIVIQSCPYSIK